MEITKTRVSDPWSKEDLMKVLKSLNNNNNNNKWVLFKFCDNIFTQFANYKDILFIIIWLVVQFLLLFTFVGRSQFRSRASAYTVWQTDRV